MRLDGRESVTRLVGKRRFFLPNRQTILSTQIQEYLKLSLTNDAEESFPNNGADESPNAQTNDDGVSSSRVSCPVCGQNVLAENEFFNSHLDICLKSGIKRKLTQKTLLELGFSSSSSNSTACNGDSGNNIGQNDSDSSCSRPGMHINSPSFGTLSNCNPIKTSPISSNWKTDGNFFDINATILETFIVGRRYRGGEVISQGTSIFLSRDPDNIKDSNAIKVFCDVENFIGFIPRILAQHLSPLIDKYNLIFKGKVTSIPEHSYDDIKIQIVCQKPLLFVEMDHNAVNYIESLWSNALDVVESMKIFPPQKWKYHINFCVLIQEFMRHSSDLLTVAEIRFIKTFNEISEDSQRLFIRLYTRKGPWFRVSNVSYSEISDVQEALKKLIDTNYLFIFKPSKDLSGDTLREILNVLNVKELQQITSSVNQGCKRVTKIRRKQDIIESILSLHQRRSGLLLQRKLSEITQLCFRISSVAECLFWRAERFFFLNGEQNLSTFLLVDLGIVKYPSYSCISQCRLFECRSDMIAYEEAIEVAQLMDESFDADDQSVLKYIQIVASSIEILCKQEIKSPIFESRHFSQFSASWVYSKLVSLGISFLERHRRYTDAIKLLKLLLRNFTCDRRKGTWTLRLSIDLEHIGHLDESLSVAENGLLDILIRAGQRVALKRRVLRLGKPPRRWKIPIFSTLVSRKIPEVKIQGRPLNCRIGAKSSFYDYEGEKCGVEHLALQYYYSDGGGWKGVLSESGIWNTIFSLLMWDIIFADVPDVFHNKFQTAPLDMGTDLFYSRRKEMIDCRLGDIMDGMGEEMVIAAWELHEHTLCSGVNWKRHSLSEIRAAVASVGGHCLASLCRIFAEDYQSWCSGMPDLLLWRLREDGGGGDAKLVEVKGPRDRLSEQQLACLLLLMDCGFAVEVCKVGLQPLD